MIIFNFLLHCNAEPGINTAHKVQPIIYKTLTIDLILNHYLRFKFVVLVFVTFGVRAYSQTKNNISFLYRADRNDVGTFMAQTAILGITPKTEALQYYLQQGYYQVIFHGNWFTIFYL